MKKIIIAADDFGYSKIFNEEIIKLADDEKITAISVMVDYLDDSQKEQVWYIKKFKNILGLHIDFENIGLEKTNFSSEIKRQYDNFIEIFSFKPVFLDMHKYSYKVEGQKEIEKFCLENNLFYRNLSGGVYNNLTTSKEKITGSFKTFDEMENIIQNKLEDGDSATILFHPGRFDKYSKSSFNKERIKDVENIILLNEFIDLNSDKFKKIEYKDLVKES